MLGRPCMHHRMSFFLYGMTGDTSTHRVYTAASRTLVRSSNAKIYVTC